MSVPTIAPYFPFHRIKIVKQSLLPDISEARISAEPDKRFHPICHCCGKKVTATHSWTQRTIRDLNLAATRVWIKHLLDIKTLKTEKRNTIYGCAASCYFFWFFSSLALESLIDFQRKVT